jgi:Tfp pilus assembly protein FimT
MAYRRRAFSLVELVVVVIFLAIVAAVAVPRFNYSAVASGKAGCLASRIVTDLRLARTMAMSDAATNADGFALGMAGSEPYNGFEIVDLSDNSRVAYYEIESAVSCTGGSSFRFDPTGILKAGSDSSLTVSGGKRTFIISIVPATGMVTCRGN